MVSPAQALALLEARSDPGRAAALAARHKAPRRCLGVAVPEIDALARAWRADLDVPGRVALADGLWQSDVHEARIAAARLLTQARLRPDAAAWRLIASWVPGFDDPALADHAAAAGARRLVADPARLDAVEGWLDHPNPWARRAALVFTLPWTRQNHPSAAELAARDRILGWCAALARERGRSLQQAVARWLRDLSRHDAPRVRRWLAVHGDRLTPFARAGAARHLPAD